MVLAFLGLTSKRVQIWVQTYNIPTKQDLYSTRSIFPTVPIFFHRTWNTQNSGVTTNETQCRAVTVFRIKEFSRNMTAVGLFSHISTNFEFTSKTWAQNIKKIGDASRYISFWLKYGFYKKSLRKDATLTSWTLFSPVFFQINADWLKLHWKANLVMDFFVKINFPPISTDLEKNGGKKCSTRQSCIFPKWLLINSIF